MTPPAWGHGPLRDWNVQATGPRPEVGTVRSRLLVLATCRDAEEELELWTLPDPRPGAPGATVGAWLLHAVLTRPLDLLALRAGYDLAGPEVLAAVDGYAEDGRPAVAAWARDPVGRVRVSYDLGPALEPLAFVRAPEARSPVLPWLAASPDLWRQAEPDAEPAWLTGPDALDAARLGPGRPDPRGQVPAHPDLAELHLFLGLTEEERRACYRDRDANLENVLPEDLAVTPWDQARAVGEVLFPRAAPVQPAPAPGTIPVPAGAPPSSPHDPSPGAPAGVAMRLVTPGRVEDPRYNVVAMEDPPAETEPVAEGPGLAGAVATMACTVCGAQVHLALAEAEAEAPLGCRVTWGGRGCGGDAGAVTVTCLGTRVTGAELARRAHGGPPPGPDPLVAPAPPEEASPAVPDPRPDMAFRNRLETAGRCEWNPATGEPATVKRPGCASRAVLIVGARHAFKLCASCAVLAPFARKRSRIAMPGARPEEAQCPTT